MLVELLKRLILVVLPRYVCAHVAKGVQLFFDVFGRCLDVGFDPPEVFRTIHLRSGITDDLDTFGEELVSVLHVCERPLAERDLDLTRPKSAGKVFFFAKSPEAPSTIMT